MIDTEHLYEAHGLIVESTHGGNIIVFRIRDYTRETMDAWAQQVIQHTDKNQDNICFLYDVKTNEPMVITNYGEQKVAEMQKTHPNAQGKIAVLVPQDTFGYWVTISAEQAARRRPGVTTRAFFHNDEAINWLNS